MVQGVHRSVVVSLAERKLPVVILPLFLNEEQAGLCDGCTCCINLAVASLKIHHNCICIFAPPVSEWASVTQAAVAKAWQDTHCWGW